MMAKTEPGEAEFKVLWDAAMDVIRAYDGMGTREVQYLAETMHGIAEVSAVPRAQLTTQVHDYALAKYEEN